MQGTKVIPLEEIERLARQIVERFRPQRVILFGSQATGKATDESDVDLLVVMDTGGEPPHEVAHRIRISLEPPKREWMGRPFSVWLDIHVLTPDAFEAALKRKSIFLTTAVTEGIVLYEAPHATPLSALLTQQTSWGGEGMKPETQEWVTKAEGDWRDANFLRQSPTPNWDNICFHAQQCAEKYLKAFLEERGIAFPKTHDLVELLECAGGQLSELDPLRSDLAQLSRFAVLPRYIGFRATQQDAENALQIAERVRQVVQAKLGLR
ncbi:MAG: HEPN domain-containing protein [Armatimonadota bacterium]|nr:HEPN domain-containing protein [Armatimonadota bacterium]MDT7972706.1 HEPN domain-containing protein [Armatimonadota bacterium]